MNALSESEKRKGKDNIIKIINLFKLRKGINNRATKDIKSLFRVKRKTKHSKDNNEKQAMHSKSNNIQVMTYDNVNKVVKEFFESFFPRYQIGLETSMRDSDFIFDDVN